MKTMICTAVVAVATLAAGGARADTFSPPGISSTFSGLVTFEQDIKLTSCTLSLTMNTHISGASAWISPASLSGGLCAFVSFSGFPWPVTVAAPVPPPTGVTATKLRISGINVTALTASCAGSSLVGWDESGPLSKIIFTDPQSNIPPVAPATKPCRIVGTVTQTAPPKITITN